MDKKLIDSYLENIAELVVDEDKIVTYKSLSRSLGIHVNTAKQLLYTYLTQQKIKNAFPTSATYLLAGKLADGSFNITIVNENELESTYPKFIEITSEHVYSVQKGKNVKEINMLCAVDKDLPESKSLVITSSKCVTKSKEGVKKKPDTNNQENKELLKKAFGGKQEINKKVESPKKQEIVKSPKKVSPTKQKEKPQMGVKKTAGNIANMFAKVAQKNAEKPKNVKSEESKGKSLISKEEVEVLECDTGESAIAKTERKSAEGSKSRIEEVEKGDSSDDEFVVVKSKKSKKASPKKKKGTKRRRIRTGSDSNDSDSSNAAELPETQVLEEDLDSVLPTAILEDDGPSESKIFNKRKKRKVVDKTVMNEDGYLETRKEVVWGTDSEDDEEPKKEEKTKPIPAKPKPATSNVAKKQSSLLTFFKKSKDL